MVFFSNQCVSIIRHLEFFFAYPLKAQDNGC